MTGPGSDGGEYGGAEVWYAIAPAALSGDKVSITYTSSYAVDDGDYYLFGLSGANTTAPFDTNSSLPVSGIGSGSTDKGPFIASSKASTSTADDYGIAFGSIFNGTGAGGGAVNFVNTDLVPSGLSEIATQGNGGGTYADVSTLAGGALASTLSQATAGWNFTSSHNSAWVMLFDAVQPAG